MKKINSFCYTSFIIANLILGHQPVNSCVYPDNNESQILTNNIGQKLAETYLQKTPINHNPNLSITEALHVQNEFVNTIKPNFGKMVGYKVGLTNKEIQTKFEVNTPLAGVLLEKMLLPNGVTIPSQFGSLPMLEGDLMVRVGNDDINKANTPAEILANLDAIIPFIELPDLIYAKDVKLDAAALIAVNIGARLGVMGEVIELKSDSNWLETIKQIELTITNQNNKILGQGNSELLLENPLNVVLWLKNDLQTQGKTLKKGDLISLGSITPMIPVKSGETVTAKYKGLIPDQIVTILINFE